MIIIQIFLIILLIFSLTITAKFAFVEFILFQNIIMVIIANFEYINILNLIIKIDNYQNVIISVGTCIHIDLILLYFDFNKIKFNLENVNHFINFANYWRII